VNNRITFIIKQACLKYWELQTVFELCIILRNAIDLPCEYRRRYQWCACFLRFKVSLSSEENYMTKRFILFAYLKKKIRSFYIPLIVLLLGVARCLNNFLFISYATPKLRNVHFLAQISSYVYDRSVIGLTSWVFP